MIRIPNNTVAPYLVAPYTMASPTQLRMQQDNLISSQQEVVSEFNNQVLTLKLSSKEYRQVRNRFISVMNWEARTSNPFQKEIWLHTVVDAWSQWHERVQWRVEERVEERGD